MDRLKINEFGQLSDERTIEINKEIEDALIPIFEKHKDICSFDLEFLINRKASWLSTTRLLDNVRQ